MQWNHKDARPFRKIGGYGPNIIGTYDRKGCGGQTAGSCGIDETIIAHW